MSTSTTLTSIALLYFPICGRGEPIRYLLEDAGVAYEESNDVERFRRGKEDCEEYAFGQLPRVTVNGTHLFQQDAILRFFAKTCGYHYSGDIWKEALVDQLQDACEDLNIAYVRCIYSPDSATLLEAFVKDHVPKVMRQVEHLFAKNKHVSGYFVQDKPTFAEFHLLYLLHALTRLTPTLLATYPTLRAWNDQMWAREGLRKYKESGRMKEMLNGNANGQREVQCGA